MAAGARWTRGSAPDLSLTLRSATTGPFHISNIRQYTNPVPNQVFGARGSYLVWTFGPATGAAHANPILFHCPVTEE